MLKLVVQPVGQRRPAIGLLGLAAVEICLLVEDATKYGPFVAIRQGDWALGKRLFVITETGRFKVPFSSTSGMNPQFVERRMAKWAAERTDDIQQIRDGHSAP